jgi:hypothetical protein
VSVKEYYQLAGLLAEIEVPKQLPVRSNIPADPVRSPGSWLNPSEGFAQGSRNSELGHYARKSVNSAKEYYQLAGLLGKIEVLRQLPVKSNILADPVLALGFELHSSVGFALGSGNSEFGHWARHIVKRCRVEVKGYYQLARLLAKIGILKRPPVGSNIPADPVLAPGF